jgi:Holliday junction DNA helicase RuvB
LTGSAGVQAMGHSLNIPTETLEDEIESFLLRIGFLLRTPRGRMITANALAHPQLTPQNDKGGCSSVQRGDKPTTRRG